MKKIHVALNRIKDTAIIAAGSFSKNDRWIPRSDVTEEAFIAVRDFLLTTMPKDQKMNGLQWKDQNGTVLKLVLCKYENGEINEENKANV